MKRLLCFLTAVFIVISFAGCGKEDTSSENEGMDVEYYLKIGKIPECPYNLGAQVSKVKDELNASAEADSDKILEITEGERSVKIQTESFLYYYEKSGESKGISYIVSLDRAFGFELGTIIIEIEEKLQNTGLKKVSESSDLPFFMPYDENYSVLEYQLPDKPNKLIFVFIDNALCATAIYNSENWTL